MMLPGTGDGTVIVSRGQHLTKGEISLIKKGHPAMAFFIIIGNPDHLPSTFAWMVTLFGKVSGISKSNPSLPDFAFSSSTNSAVVPAK